MAEPKTKAVNGGPNGNHVPDKSSKHSKLWQLVALAKELSKDAESIHDFDKSLEERKGVDQELEAKRGEVKTLREFNDKIVREFSEYKTQASAKTETLFSEFEQKYKTYESNKDAVEAMEKEVVDLREKVAAAEAAQKSSKHEAEKLRQRAQAADARSKNHVADIKSMKDECEEHRARMQNGLVELDACKTQLAEAREELGQGILHDYDAEGLRKLSGLDLKALSKRCHSLVMDYFNDPDGAEDSASEIQDLQSRFPQVPLTTSTTRPAALMRCAVAEAVIAEVFRSQIFVPFHLPNGHKAAACSLLELFGDDDHDKKRQSVYRSQVLGAVAAQDGPERARAEDDLVRRAANEVRTTLHPLVVAFKQAGFYSAVPGLFRDALQLWGEVQRSRDLISAEVPDLGEVHQPGRHEEFDNDQGAAAGGGFTGKGGKTTTTTTTTTTTASSTNSSRAAIAAVLFPQVVSREDMIFNGVALWSTQGAVVAAAQEAVVPAHASNGGGAEPVRQGHGRRKSVISSDMPGRGRPVMNGA